MLSKVLQSTRLAKFKLAHFSLALVGVMWVFPFLYYRHENPFTTFDQEWWCAVLGVLALVTLTERPFWKAPKIPRIAQLPAALIVILSLQVALGKVAYFAQALLYLHYLLFASVLMLLGARLRAFFGFERMAVVLAFFLLVGAELSAMVGALQHYEWHTPLDAVVVMQSSSALYGNLAQPNHFADYIALGVISLGLLFQRQKIAPVSAILLAVPLLFAMTLSGSRSSLLYLILMTGLAGWSGRRDATLKPLLRYCLLLIVGFGLMHLLVQLPFMAAPESSTTSVQRLLAYNGSGDTGGSIRLYLWREAILMLMQFPMLGTGFGQFAWYHFQMLPTLRPVNIVGFYNNAHSLVFQLAAETGIAGLLALFVSLGIWIHGQRRVPLSAQHWWGYAVLGVLGIHSLLEYPLWYAYFLAIAAILLGALDETHYRLAQHGVWRISLMAIMLLGLASLVQLRIDYRTLKDTIAIPMSSNNAKARIREGLLSIQHRGSLLSPYSDKIFLEFADVNADHIKQKLALGSSVMHFVPIPMAVYRQAYFLAQDGQTDRSRRLLEQAIWSYPDDADARQLLQNLAAKDPAHFSGLLEFYLQKQQERARAVRNK